MEQLLETKTMESDTNERAESFFSILNYLLTIAKSDNEVFVGADSQLLVAVTSFFDNHLLYLLSTVGER